jgi:hypothetical protein
MASSVTVPGASGSIVLTTGPGDTLKIAQQVGAALAASSNLVVTTDTVAGPLTPAPVNGSTNELVVSVPGGASGTIPAGYAVVVATGTSPNSLSGANVNLLTGGDGGTFTVSGSSTVAAAGGDNTITASGNYLLSFGAGTLRTRQDQAPSRPAPAIRPSPRRAPTT